MKISGEIPLKQVPLLHQMGITLPGINGRLCPHFEERKLSKEEEDRLILKALPPGHRIPLFPATRARLLSQAR